MILNFSDASISPQVQKLAAHLELPPSRMWNVIDEDEHLELFHYNPEIVPAGEIGAIRGLVYDPRGDAIIARSYSYTPSVVLPSIKLSDDGCLRLDDPENGKKYELEGGKFYFKQGFEGTVMRVFKHHGKVYHSSHRRLDTSRSRWGSSPPFLSVYYELGGPKDEELFDPEKEYSPFCYLFLMVHPTLLMSSRENVGKGYLVFLGALRLWNDKYESVDNEPKTFPTLKGLPDDLSEPFILEPPEISLELANKHLEKGEFVIVYSREHREGEMPSLIRVSSPAYEDRVRARNNDPNTYHRFVELSSRASLMNRDAFVKMYGCPPKTSLQERYACILEEFRKNLPLRMDDEAKDFVSRLYKDREELSSWLTDLVFDGVSSIKDEKVPPRVSQIVALFSRKTPRGNRKNVRKDIVSLLIKEPGASFYKMLRSMRTCKHHKSKAAAAK